MTWRKSTYSTGGDGCIEVTDWRTASGSNPNGACIEVGAAPDGIGVRDTKDRGGPVLHVPRAAWAEFTTRISQLVGNPWGRQPV